VKKSFALFVLLALVSITAFAQRRGPDYPRGPVTCAATDVGWEEHFGGHRDCGSCLQKHDRCTETCSIQSFSCTSKGRTAEGRVLVFRGEGRTRWEAENEARRRCDWNRNVRGCIIDACGTRSQVVSRRSCR